jgi:8-oxo-dGTP pyrophosphatase MutT (NUDIX family)
VSPDEPERQQDAARPRPAAAAILVKDGGSGPEVLLVRRSPEARFMADTWVFPGGAVERDADSASDERELDRAHRTAALRELREEAGITLTGDEAELVEFAHWITPSQLSIRFDARFYLARVAESCEPRVDGEECVEARWLTPQAALAAARAGELRLAFPTIKQLEQLSAFASAEELIEHARGLRVSAVEPRVRVSGGTAEILLPGEPGYEAPADAGGAAPPDAADP